jgi:SAM-dependent methyltransferase
VRDGGEALRGRATALAAAVCRETPHHIPLVVEVGCGARSHLEYPSETRLMGLDMSPTQLQRNTAVRWRVLGDAERLALASGCADVAVSWDVLEHLAHPARALAELARVVRPGGLIVIGLPNVLSLKGVITRLTPWWVHVWVYRHVLGDATAGTDASDQFPTTMRLGLRAAGLRRFAAASGLDVLVLETYEGPVPLHFRRRHRIGGLALSAVGAVSRALSAGRYDATASDMVVVLRRPGPA